MQKLGNLVVKFSLVLVALLVGLALISSCGIVNKRARLLSVGNGESVASLTTIVCIISGAVFLVCILNYAFRIINRLNKKSIRVFTIVLFSAYVLIQVLVVAYFQSLPITDSFTIQNQALTMAKGEAEIISNDTHYFAIYRNNNIVVVILMYFYKLLMMFGIRNFYLATECLNALMIFVGQVCAYYACKKIFGANTACKFMLLSLMQPVLFFSIPWIYSVTLCLPLMSSVMLLAVCIYNQKNKVVRWIQITAFALLCALGYFIRPVVLIVAFAVAICAALYVIKKNGNLKRVLAIAASGLVLFGAFFVGLSAVDKKYYPDNSKNYPMSVWLLVGLHGNGTLNEEDKEFLKRYDTTEELQKATVKRIKDNIEKMGASGLIELFITKNGVTWSDGTANYAARLQQNEKYGKVFDYVAGNKTDLVALYCQILRTAILFAALYFVIRCFWKKKTGFWFLPILIVLGGMLFYLVWEAKESFSIPFMFFVTMMAACGFNEIGKIDKNITSYSVLVSIGMIVVFAGISYSTFSTQIDNYRKYSIISVNTHGCKSIKADEIEQSFRSYNDVQYVEFMAKRIRGLNNYNTKYEISLLRNKKLLEKQVVDSDGVRNEQLKIKFKTVNTNNKDEFKVSIKKIGNGESTIQFYKVEEKNANSYIGRLITDGKERMGDLYMSVYAINKQPYMTPIAYILVCLVVAAVSLVVFLLYDKRIKLPPCLLNENPKQ